MRSLLSDLMKGPCQALDRMMRSIAEGPGDGDSVEMIKPPGTQDFATDSNPIEGQERAPEELPLEARVEALLFVSASPVTASQLGTALGETAHRIEKAIGVLESNFARRGIRLQKHGNQYQLTSAPELSSDIERFLDLENTTRLTRAALEVMSIIAYQQLVTRPQIDAIRGVNSDSVLRTLLRHGLIEEAGRSEGPGRPILYATTSEFLQFFGLQTIKDLPALDPDLSADFDGIIEQKQDPEPEMSENNG